MARHGLRGVDDELPGVFAEDFLDGLHFVDVADVCGRAVRVEVLDVLGGDAGVAERHAHAAGGTVGRRGRDVEGVAREAVADDFGVDVGAAGAGVLKLLENEDAGAFAHHEAVAVLVEGTGGGLRIVVATGERMHVVEAADAHGMNRGLAAARHHHGRVAAGDDVHGLADGVKARRAGGHVGDVRALEVLHDRELARGHVDDAARNEEGRDAARTALVAGLVVRADERKAADARTDGAAAFRRELVGDLEAGVFKRHDAGGDAEVNEAVEAAHFLDAEVLARIEVLHFAGDLAAEGGGVESGDAVDAGLAFEGGLPARGDVVADRRNHTETGNDNTTVHHGGIPCCGCSGKPNNLIRLSALGTSGSALSAFPLKQLWDPQRRIPQFGRP